MPFIPLYDDNPRILIRRPWVTWGLILAACLAFALQVAAGPRGEEHLVYGLGMIPATLVGGAQLAEEYYLLPAPLTLITAMFLHGDILHLGGNMLYLWVFGDNVEDSMGHGRFAAFYLVCGILASLAQVLADPGATAPTIGASGAISGILGAYLVLHPKARVLVPIFFIPIFIRAYLLLIVWIGFQVLAATAGSSGTGGVAWWAHIGGFVAGAVLIVWFRLKTIPLWGGQPPRGLRMAKRRRAGDRERDADDRPRRRRGPWG